MKGITTLIVVILLGLSLRNIGLLPVNNLLIGSGNHVPYSNLGTRSINQTTANRLRIEAPSLLKARIIESVGEAYFNEHFSEQTCEVLDSTDGDWFAFTKYTYTYSVGNYTGRYHVGAWLNEGGDVIYTEGIPRPGNLMPFKITRESAVAIARYVIRFGNPLGGYTGVDAYIVYVGTYPLTSGVDRYAWVVNFWKITVGDPLYGGATGESTIVIIDAQTAWVYATQTSQFMVMA